MVPGIFWFVLGGSEFLDSFRMRERPFPRRWGEERGHSLLLLRNIFGCQGNWWTGRRIRSHKCWVRMKCWSVYYKKAKKNWWIWLSLVEWDYRKTHGKDPRKGRYWGVKWAGGNRWSRFEAMGAISSAPLTECSITKSLYKFLWVPNDMIRSYYTDESGLTPSPVIFREILKLACQVQHLGYQCM